MILLKSLLLAHPLATALTSNQSSILETKIRLFSSSTMGHLRRRRIAVSALSVVAFCPLEACFGRLGGESVNVLRHGPSAVGHSVASERKPQNDNLLLHQNSRQGQARRSVFDDPSDQDEPIQRWDSNSSLVWDKEVCFPTMTITGYPLNDIAQQSVLNVRDFKSL